MPRQLGPDARPVRWVAATDSCWPATWNSRAPNRSIGGIFAIPGSPVTLKLTLIARNAPDNCAPPSSVAGCKN